MAGPAGAPRAPRPTEGPPDGSSGAPWGPLLRRGVLRLARAGRRLGRAAAVRVAQVRLEVGPQPGAVFPLEGGQLLDLALEAGALLLEGADDLGVPALGVLVERGRLGAGLALHGLGAGARVAQRGVGAVLGLADHLLALGAGVVEQPVAGVLGAADH